MDRRRPLVLVALTLAATTILTAACGGGGSSDDGPATVTGRVMSIDAERYCVSPDRGDTRTCVAIPDPKAVDGVDVGECVTTTPDLTSEGARVEVVDESACAAGDLGD